MESPYKHSLSEIKQIDLIKDDIDDFKTPPVKRTQPKVLPKQQISKSKRKYQSKLKKLTKNCILKTTKDNFENVDINPENLQLALALSKSTFEKENPEYNQNLEEDILSSAVNSTTDKIVTSTVLERFGFKSNKYKSTLYGKNVAEVRHINTLFC